MLWRLIKSLAVPPLKWLILLLVMSGGYLITKGLNRFAGDYDRPLFIALLSTLAIACILECFRSKRRQPKGVCPCGYDLRGTPHRCPECGRLTNVAISRDSGDW